MLQHRQSSLTYVEHDGLKDLKEFRGLKNVTKLPFLLWKELKTTYLYMGLVGMYRVNVLRLVYSIT